MTEIEQEKLFKKFKKVLDARDSHKIDKALYYHLYQHTGFIAHYDIHGFRETYADRGFLDFVVHFEQCYYLCYGDHGDFNRRLKQYVLDNAAAIRQELELKASQKELMLMQKLAEKHGYSVLTTSADSPNTPMKALDFTLSRSGQFEFAI